jgi:hypothetical protein
MFSNYKITAALLFSAFTAIAQKPERQISFAQESKPHSYYVEQAGLWLKELDKDNTNEDSWYNYFRACRNAQGSADWKTDFVNESSSLKLGNEIVALMKQHIPGSFTYYYVSYLHNGIGTANGDNLLKAYKMRPDFEGIHSSVISYAVSDLNKELRKSVNKIWYKTNYLSPQLLLYAYNVLMSLDTNAVLITCNDNDTYPLWMLQDALNIRTDVEIVNVDFMLIDNYRNANLKLMGVQPFEIKEHEKDINKYGDNWSSIIKYILSNCPLKRPLYIGMMVDEHLYKGFEDKLITSGLALKYTAGKEDPGQLNKTLYEEKFLLDYIKTPILIDKKQAIVDAHNLTYINMLKTIFDYYNKNNKVKAEEIKNMAIKIVTKTGNEAYLKAVEQNF